MHAGTARAVQNFEWRTIDKVKFVGKSEPVETVEIMAYKGEITEDQRSMREFYQQGIEFYQQQKWEEAQAKFRDSEKFEEMFPNRPTTPSQVYLERCEALIADPPGDDWDGTWSLVSK